MVIVAGKRNKKKKNGGLVEGICNRVFVMKVG